MTKKVSFGVFILFLFSILAGGADKEKKAYELIYKDIQLLKQKILLLEDKLESNTEDIKRIKDQFKELLTLVRQFQRDQASFKEEQKQIPAQYQILLEKLESMNSQLIRVFGELIEIKKVSLTPVQPAEETADEEALPAEEVSDKTETEEEAPQTPLPSPSRPGSQGRKMP